MQLNPMGCIRRCNFILKRNQPLFEILTTLGSSTHTNETWGEGTWFMRWVLGNAEAPISAACTASKMLRAGPQPAEHTPLVKYYSQEFGKAFVTASPHHHGTHLMTAEVNRNTGQGQGTWTSLKLPANLKRYSKDSSAISYSLCSSKYLVNKLVCQLAILWNKHFFFKQMIQQFLKGNWYLLVSLATRRQAMNKIS